MLEATHGEDRKADDAPGEGGTQNVVVTVSIIWFGKNARTNSWHHGTAFPRLAFRAKRPSARPPRDDLGGRAAAQLHLLAHPRAVARPQFASAVCLVTRLCEHSVVVIRVVPEHAVISRHRPAQSSTQPRRISRGCVLSVRRSTPCHASRRFSGLSPIRASCLEVRQARGVMTVMPREPDGRAPSQADLAAQAARGRSLEVPVSSALSRCWSRWAGRHLEQMYHNSRGVSRFVLEAVVAARYS